MNCALCSKTISRHVDGCGRKTKHFRSCDANVCSWKCAVNRRDEISVFDPDLNSPNYWHYFNAAADNEGASKLKRSSSEYSLRSKNKYDKYDIQCSIDILPIITEEKVTSVNINDTTINIALFFTIVFSLLCVIR
jgi:hypothetical protein|tara:strand:- start:501 stop:905 length:405 start_codon:yes stop_codon:yes gene_type:complete